MTIGRETSPIGPLSPTFPGQEDSPSCPAKNGSSHEPALIIPITGDINEEDSVVLAIERFSLFRKAVEGKSLSIVIIGVSESSTAFNKAVGATLNEKSSNKDTSICSFVFIY